MFVKQHNSTIKLSGFTLIEILVTIGILAIMSTLAVFSFNSSNPERQLNLTAENIIGQLQQAQSLAFTGAKQDALTPNGYGVFIKYLSAFNVNYLIYADKNTPYNQFDSGDQIIEKIYIVNSSLEVEINNYVDNFTTILTEDMGIDIFFLAPMAYLNLIDDDGNLPLSSEIILKVNSAQKTIKIRADSNSFWIE